MAERKRFITEVADWNTAEISGYVAGVANFLRISLVYGQYDLAKWREVKADDIMSYITEPRSEPFKLPGIGFYLQFWGPSPKLYPNFEYDGSEIIGITWRQRAPKIELDYSEVEDHGFSDHKQSLLDLYKSTMTLAAQMFDLSTREDSETIVFPPPKFAKILPVDAVPLSALLETNGLVTEWE
jgi:hypothetical protein